jgi:hypothetical protein
MSEDVCRDLLCTTQEAHDAMTMLTKCEMFVRAMLGLQCNRYKKEMRMQAEHTHFVKKGIPIELDKTWYHHVE